MVGKTVSGVVSSRAIVGVGMLAREEARDMFEGCFWLAKAAGLDFKKNLPPLQDVCREVVG